MNKLLRRFAIVFVTVAAITSSQPLAAAEKSSGLSATQQQQLKDSKYVYIQSTRKDGALSAPAEIWYMFHDGAVWVGTTPNSWRAKRIKAGRPAARISVGKTEANPFSAKGSIEKDAKVEALLMETYAKKYPEGWSKYEDKFRQGFKDGSRVLIKYTPE